MNRANNRKESSILYGLKKFLCDPTPPSSTYTEMMLKDRDYVVHKIFISISIGATFDIINNTYKGLKAQSGGEAMQRWFGAAISILFILFVMVVIRFRKKWNKCFFLTYEICLLYTSPSPRDS
eukprot:TRINITY_DN7573_c0_g2_i1.p1 TRINITY_DN7573_c0_g2~~TRINITY_DN7573_c0_g2_i1.p1  ORF type:complete len:123 (+),score=10.78 TRINITY_DN7573_c0_g2_i1:121-489(+)